MKKNLKKALESWTDQEPASQQDGKTASHTTYEEIKTALNSQKEVKLVNEIPKDTKIKKTFRLPEEVVLELEVYCAKKRMKQQDVLIEALTAYFNTLK